MILDTHSITYSIYQFYDHRLVAAQLAIAIIRLHYRYFNTIYIINTSNT